MDKKTIGERIRIVRESKNRSQEEFALDTAVTNVTISRYEKGHRVPDADFLNRLVGLYGCDPGWLLTGKGEMKSQPGTVSTAPESYSVQGGSPSAKSPMDRRRLKLEGMLNRIIAEGVEKKINVVEGQLELLDPGETKPPVPKFGSHVSEAARKEAAAILDERIEKQRQKALGADVLNSKVPGRLTGS